MAEKKSTNVYVSLRGIQNKLNAPKGQYNAFGKYKYRSCEDILAAVKPLLGEYDCSLTLVDDIMLVGSRFYIKATATLFDSCGNTISTTAFAREEEAKKGLDASQVTGAASSYARKYALNGLFAIDDTKDADTLNNNAAYTQSVVDNTARLKEALAKVASATTADAVKSIYKEYADIKGVKEFYDAVVSRGKELSKPSAA